VDGDGTASERGGISKITFLFLGEKKGKATAGKRKKENGRRRKFKATGTGSSRTSLESSVSGREDPGCKGTVISGGGERA